MNASNASSGGGHDGGGDAAANKAAASARRQHNNDMAAEYFAAAMCGLIAIFTLLHWTRLLFSRSHRIPTGLSKPFVVVSRRLRNLLVRGAPGFNSAGHVLLVAVYVGINLAILLTNVDKTAINYVAARFGWYVLSLSDLSLVLASNEPGCSWPTCALWSFSRSRTPRWPS